MAKDKPQYQGQGLKKSFEVNLTQATESGDWFVNFLADGEEVMASFAGTDVECAKLYQKVADFAYNEIKENGKDL